MKEYQVVFKSLDEYIQDGSFVLNLLYIFVHGHQVAGEANNISVENRQLAGLIIKNYVCPRIHTYSEFIQGVLKTEILSCLSDPINSVQNIAAIVYNYMLNQVPVENWELFISPLVHMLVVDAGQTIHVQGSLKAIKIICEDASNQLCSIKFRDDSVLHVLVPRLIQLLSDNSADVKLDALMCLNSLIMEMPAIGNDTSYIEQQSASRSDLAHMYRSSAILLHYVPALLQSLSSLANDSNSLVRGGVCRSILLLTPTYCDNDNYKQLFPSLCVFMLNTVLDPVEAVAIVACEFWGNLVDDNEQRHIIVQHLGSLIPSLVARLTYSEEQLLRERYHAEAENSGEKKLLFKPVHSRGGGEGGSAERRDEEELENQWTLRMQAALVLDSIGMNYEPRMVLSVALPCIETRLKDSDSVWVREAGMLALGALSKGCINEMSLYLPSIFPFFVGHLSDSMPEMRCISCWVLSRYSTWLFEFDNEDDDSYDSPSGPAGGSELKQQLFVSSLRSLSQAMMDASPKVQAAACSAMCTVIENATSIDRDLLIPYARDLLGVVAACFALPYGVKSAMLLIDLVGTLADCLGEELYNISNHPGSSSSVVGSGSDSLVTLYLPPILQRFYTYSEDDMYLFPVLECLTSVTAAAKLDMLPYAKDLLTRCLKITNRTMTLNAAYESNVKLRSGSGVDVDEESDVPVKDFAICCLDVISGLCEGLTHYFAQLVTECGFLDTLISLIVSCAYDSLPDLRQSSILLVGEISKSAATLFNAAAQNKMLELVLLNVDEEFESCCNNAVWALGEIAVQYGGALTQSSIGHIAHRLVSLMQLDNINMSIKQNVGVTLGRLCVTNTAAMTEVVATEHFCELCNYVKLAPSQTTERTHAFAGLVAVLRHRSDILLLDFNITGKVPGLLAFLVACASWEDPPDEPLSTQLGELLRGARQAVGAEAWRQMVARGVDRETLGRVTDMFKLQ